MDVERAQEAPGKTYAGAPTGFRKLTLGLLNVDRAAEGFAGLPEGVTTPGQLLSALKAAAPRLGLSARLVHAVDWLCKFTQPQDWGRGGRPIVWPSASMQQEALGLSPTQAKAINRALIEAGLITMKDSPNGKRYGARDRQGRIVEAYGFDLSPLAARHAEFVRLAAEARTERAEMGRLRRRATIARNGIIQIIETVREYDLMAEEWTILVRETRDIATALRKVENPDEMAFGVASLERRQKQARERLETLLAVTPAAASEAVNSDPKGTEYRPHQYTYKLELHPEQDTVIADKGCSRASVDTVLEPQAPSAETGAGKGSEQARPQSTPSPSVRDDGTVLRLRCDELVHLAPKLRSYIASPDPGWRDIVEAADWLRHDLGVSKSLWGEACLAMGREQAAIALAIVSAKPPEHFRSSPGGYFHGMVTKAKAGHLNLDRTIWKLRGERKDSQPWQPQMRPGGGFGRARPG